MSFASPDFEELYRTAVVAADARRALGRVVGIIETNRQRYEAVESVTHVPWWMVAALHYKETGLRFDRHLHNGDPLTSRTVHVPAGRPLSPEPPYTFAQSACDALAMKARARPLTWDAPRALEFAERYNGLGYRSRGIYSPYVWCGTQHYTRGKFVADHVFDANAVSKNLGVAALLKVMSTRLP